MPVQPHQLRIARKVADHHEIGRVLVSAEDPALVPVVEALVAGRVGVLRGVGVQWWRRCLADHQSRPFCVAAHPAEPRERRPNWKTRLNGFVALVREVAVVARGDAEHAQPVQRTMPSATASQVTPVQMAAAQAAWTRRKGITCG